MAILASYELLAFSAAVYTFCNATVTRGLLELKLWKVLTNFFSSQTQQNLSLKLLWTLCVGFHSYPIYTTKRLHAQRNIQQFQGHSTTIFGKIPVWKTT